MSADISAPIRGPEQPKPNYNTTNWKEKHMKISEAYPSQYLKAADLDGHATTVTIRDIEEVEVGLEREKKFCMSFAGKSKRLVLNKTHMSSLRQIFGDTDLEELRGKRVTLVREVDFHGETHSVIRIVAAKPTVEEEFAAK